jgi:hypothetical protein
MNTVPENNNPDTESDIWNAISAFERILEVMPDDRTSLDTLVHAYTQLGDQARARDYLIRLAKVVADENDVDAAGSVLEQMTPFEADPVIQQLSDRLRAMVERDGKPLPVKSEPVAQVTVKPLLSHKINITEEMSLAWDLLQAGELTQEQYAEVVQDLTNISSNKKDQGCISVLHVIETRGFGNIDRILVFASGKGDLPIISLSGFEFSDEAVLLLPVEAMSRQGVLPFDLLGPDALVVLQNPYDLDLRKQVELSLGRRCHFFLASPHEFLASIARVQKRKAELAKPK